MKEATKEAAKYVESSHPFVVVTIDDVQEWGEQGPAELERVWRGVRPAIRSISVALMFVVIVALGAFAVHRWRMVAACEVLSQAGAQIYWQDELRGGQSPALLATSGRTSSSSPWPIWWRHSFGRPVAVVLHSARLSAQQAAALCVLTSLEYIEARGVGDDRTLMQSIASMPAVRHVRLRACACSIHELLRLRKASELRILELERGGLKPIELAVLGAELPGTQILDVPRLQSGESPLPPTESLRTAA